MKKKTDRMKLVVDGEVIGETENVIFGIDLAQGKDQTAEIIILPAPKRDALGHPWDHLEQ